MADEKLNPGQGEQIKLDISGAPPAPDLTGEGPPAPEPGSPAAPGPGDVVVDVGKIDELMAKRRAAAREAVEQQADIPGEGDKAPEAPDPANKGDVPPPRSRTRARRLKRSRGSARWRIWRRSRKSPAVAVLQKIRTARRLKCPSVAAHPRTRPPGTRAKRPRDNETKCPKARPPRSSLRLAAAPAPLLPLRRRPLLPPSRHPRPALWKRVSWFT